MFMDCAYASPRRERKWMDHRKQRCNFHQQYNVDVKSLDFSVLLEKKDRPELFECLCLEKVKIAIYCKYFAASEEILYMPSLTPTKARMV